MKYIIALLFASLLSNACFAQCSSCGQYSSGFSSGYTYQINTEYNAPQNDSIYDSNFVTMVKITDLSIAEKNAKDNNKTLLLIFTADWCRYCKPLKAAMEKNMEEINKKFVVCYINFDNNKDLARKYGIESLPSSVFIKDNGEKRTIMGFGSFQTYKKHLGL